MPVPSRRSGIDTDAGIRDEERYSSATSTVSMHSTRPERTVFVEKGNVDGWISTDVTVTLER